MKFFLSLVAVIMLSSCNNFIRYSTLEDARIERSEPEIEYFFETGDQVATSTRVPIQLEKIETTDVNEFEDLTKREEFTPYSGLREFYEVPCGLIMLPIGIITNVLDVALVGMIPNKMSEGSLNVAFTGFNPFLNWESETRLEYKLVDNKERLVESRVDKTPKLPAKDVEIEIYAGDIKVGTMMTDSKGRANLSIVDEQFINALQNHSAMTFKIDDEEKTITLPRQLRFRVKLYRQIVDKYMNDQSAENLANAVVELDKNDFHEIATALETTELKKHAEDEHFKTSFEAILQKKMMKNLAK